MIFRLLEIPPEIVAGGATFWEEIAGIPSSCVDTTTHPWEIRVSGEGLTRDQLQKLDRLGVVVEQVPRSRPGRD